MKNINWSNVKTNVIVFLLTGIVFTIVGSVVTLKYQGDVKQAAAEMHSVVLKSIEVKAEAAPSK